ncbi:hypothetical protein ACFFJY_14410 [Fictibacillus aquaticus]|uniref:Uncharacterized protein n=1 Tax=Fictibacillus aquaticus TaxID=2021314 RepID=A0A235FDH8_9BACL|nr:hypothetical protein CGZ90_05835 [Fictibacillus aquaticus]
MNDRQMFNPYGQYGGQQYPGQYGQQFGGPPGPPPGPPEEDTPQYGPPQQFSQSQVPQSFFTAPPASPQQIRSMMCRCLGRWGLMGLRSQGPFGRDFWFYPSEIRINSVSGYIWRGNRAQRVRYNYNQIRNFMCF